MVTARSVARRMSVVLAVVSIGCHQDPKRDLVDARAEQQNDGSTTTTTESKTAGAAGTEAAPQRAPTVPVAPDYDRRDNSAALNSSINPLVADVSTDSGNPPLESPDKPAGEMNQPVVQLQTAVALPQSLPTGTAMGFSVDYRVVGTVQDSQVKYLWVITPPSGQPWESEVKLKTQGNLQTFVTQWGPITGSYRMRIDRVSGARRAAASQPISAEYH